MKGDFSRIRFNRGKNYTAVLEQQGRVALDADANEQQFIDAYRSRTQTIDAVGQYGGPAGDAGFQITVPGGSEIQIGQGRYYVNGLLCENPADVSYDEPAVPDQPPGARGASLISQLSAAAGKSRHTGQAPGVAAPADRPGRPVPARAGARPGRHHGAAADGLASGGRRGTRSCGAAGQHRSRAVMLPGRCTRRSRRRRAPGP